MISEIKIEQPKNENDVKGAHKVFEDFLTLYQPILSTMDNYLEQVVMRAGPSYAQAYLPWKEALHDLYKGVFLITKKIPLPDMERFIEAIKIFSLDSGIQFLHDLCVNCRITLERDWIKTFTRHIHMLLFSLTIINRNPGYSLAR